MNKKVNEMEYVYAAMLLHSAGKDIDDKAVSLDSCSLQHLSLIHI